jgi:hypothetical protein
MSELETAQESLLWTAARTIEGLLNNQKHEEATRFLMILLRYLECPSE